MSDRSNKQMKRTQIWGMMSKYVPCYLRAPWVKSNCRAVIIDKYRWGEYGWRERESINITLSFEFSTRDRAVRRRRRRIASSASWHNKVHGEWVLDWEGKRNKCSHPSTHNTAPSKYSFTSQVLVLLDFALIAIYTCWWFQMRLLLYSQNSIFVKIEKEILSSNKNG